MSQSGYPANTAKREIFRRLFVPLAREPYDWFASGEKKWEIRKQRGNFSEGQVALGRPVELRLGYRNASSSFWGIIVEVIQATSLVGVFEAVPFNQAIPGAKDLASALSIASRILRISPDQRIDAGIVAFRVQLDSAKRPRTCIKMSLAYKEMIKTRRKTTTIRRSSRQYTPGQAVIEFPDGEELPVVITAVTRLTVRDITNGDARRDGFQSVDDLFVSLRRHYPGIQYSDAVTILEFKWET